MSYILFGLTLFFLFIFCLLHLYIDLIKACVFLPFVCLKLCPCLSLLLIWQTQRHPSNALIVSLYLLQSNYFYFCLLASSYNLYLSLVSLLLLATINNFLRFPPSTSCRSLSLMKGDLTFIRGSNIFQVTEQKGILKFTATFICLWSLVYSTDDHLNML